MTSAEAKRILETALICAQSPMPLRDLRVLFDDEIGADGDRLRGHELGILEHVHADAGVPGAAAPGATASR